MGSMSVKHSVLNVKELGGAFNQEKVLVGAFSVIVKCSQTYEVDILPTAHYLDI